MKFVRKSHFKTSYRNNIINSVSTEKTVLLAQQKYFVGIYAANYMKFKDIDHVTFPQARARYCL